MPEGLDSPSMELYERMTAEAQREDGNSAARSGDGVRFVNDNYATFPFQEKLIKLTSNYYVRPSESPPCGPRPNSSEYNDVVFTTTEIRTKWS